MMKKIIALMAMSLVSTSAFAAGDPASLKIKVLGVYASLSAQCTNPIQIFLNNTGDYVDILKGPTLGGGDLPDGTYNCVIIKMSDVIKHVPLTTATSCIAGTEYTGDVCHTGDIVDALDMTPIHCAGSNGPPSTPVEDVVYMYMSTDPSIVGGNNAFKHPVTAGDGKGMRLLAPLVISSTSKAKFVVDGRGQVIAGGGECGMNPPTFSFQKL